jgi:hypothetical protein
MSRSTQGFAKVKDIRPGRVLYEVSCYGEIACNKIDTLYIIGKPKLSKYVKTYYFFNCIEWMCHKC